MVFWRLHVNCLRGRYAGLMFKEKEDRVLKNALRFLGLVLAAGMVLYLVFLAAMVIMI